MAYLVLILDTDQPPTKSRDMGNIQRGRWILAWTVCLCNHHSGGNQTLRQKLPQAAHPETLTRAFNKTWQRLPKRYKKKVIFFQASIYLAPPACLERERIVEFKPKRQQSKKKVSVDYPGD